AADLLLQPLGVGRVARGVAPLPTGAAGQRLPLRRKPIPVGDPLQPRQSLGRRVLLADGRVEAEQDARTIGRHRRTSGATFSANRRIPSYDGKSRNQSMKCDTPSPTYSPIRAVTAS